MSDAEQGRRRRVVVGVDGSAESRAALRWATEQAQLRDAELEVVTAWELPFVGLATSYAFEPGGLPDPTEWRQRAERTLEHTVTEVFGGEPPVKLVRTVEQGNAAQVLLTRAHAADMLVLGTRGTGGFVGLRVGSVSEHCVRHADCTVVVVRERG